MRGGEVTVKTGPTDQRRRILIEFDTYEQALAWYDSPLGQEAKAIREQFAHVITFYIIQGSWPLTKPCWFEHECLFVVFMLRIQFSLLVDKYW